MTEKSGIAKVARFSLNIVISRPDRELETVRLVVSYFNWMWVHGRKGNTAAERAGLAIAPWSWNDLLTYPILYSYRDGANHNFAIAVS